MKVKFTSIIWDTSIEDESPDDDLPTEVVFKNVDDTTDLENEGADLLSSTYGYLVGSFDYEVLPI